MERHNKNDPLRSGNADTTFSGRIHQVSRGPAEDLNAGVLEEIFSFPPSEDFCEVM